MSKFSFAFKHHFTGRFGLVALSVAFLGNMATILADGYLDSGWTKKASIYLNTTNNGANVTSNLTNIPVLIKLNGNNFDFSQSLVTGGGDIRFMKNDRTVLSYQIERWSDGTGKNDTAEIWVKVDTVYGNNSTQFIKMYWGKAGVISKSNSGQVFATANGFAAVYHLDEEVADTLGSASYLDATSNANNGTDYVYSTVQENWINLSHDFNGNLDYIGLPNSASLTNVQEDNYTLSAWYKPRIAPTAASTPGFNNFNSHIIIAKRGAHLGLAYTSGKTFNFMHWLTSTNTSSGDSGISAGSSKTYEPGSYYYISGNVDRIAGTCSLYVNGVLDGTSSFPPGMAAREYSNDVFHIGIGNIPSRCDCYRWAADGKIDEVRIESVSRPAGWAKLCYENQKEYQSLVEIALDTPTIAVIPKTIAKTIYSLTATTPDTFVVRNSGTTGTVAYSIAIKHSSAWLSVSPTTGSSTGESDKIVCQYGATYQTANRIRQGVDITSRRAEIIHYDPETGEESYRDSGTVYDSLWYDVYADTLVVSATGAFNGPVEIPVTVIRYTGAAVPVKNGQLRQPLMASATKTINLSVFTLSGRKIRTAAIGNGSSVRTAQAMLKGLPPGVYIIMEKGIGSEVAKQKIYKFSR